MGKLDRFMEKIGWAQAEEEEDDNETYEQPKSAVYSSTRASVRGSDTIHFTSDEPEEDVKLSYQSAYRPHKSTPRSQSSSYSEERQTPNPKGISDDIRNNKPVVINLEFVEQPIAQRITDFLCGACYALNGNIQRIADKIYMIAPGNVDIAASIDFRNTLQNEGGLVFPWGTEQ